MDIDIFICKFGSGHLKAATELKNKLQDLNGVDINIIDFIESVYPKLSDLIYWTHKQYYQHKILSLEEKQTRDNNLNRELTAKILMLKKLFFKYLDSRPWPDVFISCFSLTSYLISEYKKERKLDIPLITFITDFSFHKFWINENTNLYLVMSNFTKQKLIKVEIEPENIIIFGNKIKSSSEKSNQNILICGGGLGILPNNKKFYKKLEKFEDKNFKIVFGKNKNLYDSVSKLKLKNVITYGLVDDMEKFYDWADIYITKAGGLSIYDSIKNTLPIVYFTPFLSQEIKNKEFIDTEKIGLELKNENLKILEMLFKNNQKLELIRDNLERIRDDFSPDELLRWLENAVY